MTLKAKATAGLKWQAMELVGRQFISLVVFASLSRMLEESAFGIFGLINIYLAFVGMFASQGIRAALLQRKDVQPDHLHTAYWLSLGGAGVISLGTILFSEPIAILLGESELTPYLRWSSLLLVITASSTIHNTLFVRDMDFRRPALRMLLSNFIGGAIGVAMAWNGFGVWALIGQQFGVSLASAVFLWSASTYRPSFRFSMRRYRELRGVSSSVFATSVLWFLTTRLDQLIISRFAGVHSLGIYIIGSRLPELAKLITHYPVSQVSTPTLAKLQDDHQRMCSAIYQGTELNALVSFAIFIGVAAVASDLVPLVFGAKWQEAATICSLLAVYTLIGVLQVFNHPALVAAGANRDYILLNVWYAVGALIACAAGVRFGIAYVALGLILNGLIGAIPSFYFLKKWIGLEASVFVRKCLYPGFAAVSMAVVIYMAHHWLLLEDPTIVRLSIKVTIGAIWYTSFIWVFDRPVAKKLLELLQQALKRTSSTPR